MTVPVTFPAEEAAKFQLSKEKAVQLRNTFSFDYGYGCAAEPFGESITNAVE